MMWTVAKAARTFFTRHPLVAALCLSAALHLSLYGGWRMGKTLGWWEHQATWLLNWKKKLKPLKLQPPPALASQPEPAQREIPLIFTEVDPSTAVPEPPKNAKYYGAQSTRAANPDAAIESVVPKADGKQDKMVRLQDVPKPGPQPLQPSLPPEKAPEPEPPKAKSEPIGDLAKAKPDAALGQAPVVPRERPRTLAAARQQRAMLAGEQMKQDGGTHERGKLALDVAGTAFGSYDAALIAAVQQRWYDLLDVTQFAQRSGKVILEFRLHYDGRITDLKVDGNEVGEMLGILCQRAILDPNPYAPWPSDMRRAIAKNYRDVLFTFYYN